MIPRVSTLRQILFTHGQACQLDRQFLSNCHHYLSSGSHLDMLKPWTWLFVGMFVFLKCTKKSQVPLRFTHFLDKLSSFFMEFHGTDKSRLVSFSFFIEFPWSFVSRNVTLVVFIKPAILFIFCYNTGNADLGWAMNQYGITQVLMPTKFFNWKSAFLNNSG